MRFDITYLRGLNTSIFECLANHGLLGEFVRGGETVCVPILINRTATNQS